jgi:hypothetical protein
LLGVESPGLSVEALLEGVGVLRLAGIRSVPGLGGDELAVIAFREDSAVAAQGGLNFGRETGGLGAGHGSARLGKRVDNGRHAHLNGDVDTVQDVLALYNVKGSCCQLLFFFCTLERDLRFCCHNLCCSGLGYVLRIAYSLVLISDRFFSYTNKQ